MLAHTRVIFNNTPTRFKIYVIACILAVAVVFHFEGRLRERSRNAGHSCAAGSLKDEAVRQGYAHWVDDGVWNGRDRFVWGKAKAKETGGGWVK